MPTDRFSDKLPSRPEAISSLSDLRAVPFSVTSSDAWERFLLVAALILSGASLGFFTWLGTYAVLSGPSY
jgi:hypothetical protein